MDTVFPCCCGLDVHKKTVAACVRKSAAGGRVSEEVRTFGTMTRELLEMSDWLAAQGVTHVAMESTGVLWKPIYNLLEDRFELLLVNAQHIKRVPGRKTDIKDCQWIAQLLQHGLLKASFVPPRAQRELRDLTRHRTQLVAEKNRLANRLHKTLEDANIKLGAVATDILGVSGRRMLEALAAGQEDPEQLANFARMSLRKKIPQLRLALQGTMREHHRFMLRLLLDQLAGLERLIGRLSERIEELLRPFEECLECLDDVPGVDRRTAENVLAEIGPDMSRFPTAGHLASWAGICPGSHESAGKRKTGKINKGNRWLRQALVQAAWGASHTRDTYLSAQYRRLVARRGKKRALIAVGHTLLVIFYHLLRTGHAYRDLGPDYLDRLQPERLSRYYVKRLERLGYQVTLKRPDAA
jgi:transposase